MAIYYIDPNAGGGGDGSIGSPFNTWASVTWAAGNSYLQKRGTTFNGTVTIGASGTAGNEITIGAYGDGDKPIITNNLATTINGNGRHDVILQGIKVQTTYAGSAVNFGNGYNFTITDFEGDGGQPMLYIQKSNNITISDFELYNGTIGINGSATDGVSIYDVTITDGYIHNRGNDAIYLAAGTAISAGNVYNITISNLILDSNTGNGINIFSNESYSAKNANYAIWNLQCSNLTITNNTKTGLRVRNILGSQDSKPNSTFRHITAKNNCNGDTPGNLWFGAVNNGIIEDNISTDAKTNSTIDGAGIYIDNLCNATIVRRNYVKGCLGGAGLTTGQGIGLTGATDCLIYSNTVIGCKHGFWANTNTDPLGGTNKIYNNVFYNNVTCQTGWKDNATASTIEFKNNIGQGGTYVFYTDGVTAQTNDYNCAYGASTANYSGVTAGGNSIVQNPLFVDAANNRFDLLPNSPCINSGTSTDITDFYDRRFKESHYDMGAIRAERGALPAGVYKSHASRSKLRSI